MNHWENRPEPFKFQLSDWTLFSISLQLQVRPEDLFRAGLSFQELAPDDVLAEGSQGFLIRGMPIAAVLPVVSRVGDYLRYVPLQYQHCYIDLSLPFEDYQKKFSSKTRSTINRKVKKYAEHCGGILSWKTYRQPGEMQDFFVLARGLSKLTYQERLLDTGIPGSDEFISEAELFAADDRIRAYILFDGERPVSYLYCPVRDGILIYSYLGYDPDYIHMSVGTVLQWLAVEQMFSENRFRFFDFTEGQSDHKRLFATHQRQCANIYLVKSSLKNTVVIYSHWFMNRFSGWLGATLDRFGVKAKIRRFMRFAK